MQEDTRIDKKQMPSLKTAQFTMEQKLNYCAEWEKSGLSKASFCRLKNISAVSFKYWYYRFYFGRDKVSKEEPLSQWSPVLTKGAEQNSVNPMLEFELVLSDKVTVRTRLLRSDVVGFIQELSHAITVIR